MFSDLESRTERQATRTGHSAWLSLPPAAARRPCHQPGLWAVTGLPLVRPPVLRHPRSAQLAASAWGAESPGVSHTLLSPPLLPPPAFPITQGRPSSSHVPRTAAVSRRILGLEEPTQQAVSPSPPLATFWPPWALPSTCTTRSPEPLLFPVQGEGLTHPHLGDPGTALFPLPQQLSPPPVGSADFLLCLLGPAPGHMIPSSVTAPQLLVRLQPVTLFSKALRFSHLPQSYLKG